MRRDEKITEFQRPISRPRFRDFVYFLMAVATIWAALVIAPGAFAASGGMTNTGASVPILHPADIGASAGREFQRLDASVLSSKLPGCCERSGGYKGMSGSCQTSCPAHGCGVSGILVSLPAPYTLFSVRFEQRAADAPSSLLNQRLDRPPIIDRLA